MTTWLTLTLDQIGLVFSYPIIYNMALTPHPRRVIGWGATVARESNIIMQDYSNPIHDELVVSISNEYGFCIMLIPCRQDDE